jgi:predicted dehydrogenase
MDEMNNASDREELEALDPEAASNSDSESRLILPPGMESNRRQFLSALGAISAAGLLLPRMAGAAPKPVAKNAVDKAAKPGGKAVPSTKGTIGKTNAQKAAAVKGTKGGKTGQVQQEMNEATKAEGAIQKDKKEAVPERINVAIIGAGSQGRNLLLNALKIPGINFVAVADIWSYSRDYSVNILKKYGQKATPYTDYEEMLEKEPSIQAVIIATPDWLHSPQTVACLKAGKHVYCEKEMANTIEAAGKMVQAAKETGKLLQIGHQRRSNPRYWHVYEMINGPDKAIGRVTHTYGQWNRPKRLELGWPANRTIDNATLEKYGYETMERFRNWRWYKRYSGGAIADLGSHQIDIFSWFLRSNPESVLASGGNDYYKKGEWYDHVMAIYQYGKGDEKAGGDKVRSGPVRSFYQVLNTTGWGGYYEVFMGDEGVIEVSEDTKKGFYVRDPGAPPKKWEDDAERINAMGVDAIALTVGQTLRASGRPKEQKLEDMTNKPPHQLHLENFFSAVRNGTPLSCPPEIGYETCVTVLRANEAVEAKREVEFDKNEFHI